jgi:hypothetical protein
LSNIGYITIRQFAAILFRESLASLAPATLRYFLGFLGEGNKFGDQFVNEDVGCAYFNLIQVLLRASVLGVVLEAGLAELAEVGGRPEEAVPLK